MFALKLTSIRNGQEKRGRYLATFQGANFPENFVRNPQFSRVKLKTNECLFLCSSLWSKEVIKCTIETRDRQIEQLTIFQDKLDEFFWTIQLVISTSINHLTYLFRDLFSLSFIHLFNSPPRNALPTHTKMGEGRN